MDKAPKGFIKLDRSIFEHWIFQDAEKFKAFVDLIQLMRWKDETLILGNEVVVIPRGSYYTSELKLSERWGWSRNKVRAYLNLLAKEHMLIKKGTAKGTTLTLANYEVYQGEGTTESTAEGTSKGQQKVHQKNIKRYTKEEVKEREEVKEVNKNIRESTHSSQSLDLIKYYSELLPGQDISAHMATLDIWIEMYSYDWTKEAIQKCVSNKGRFIKSYTEVILKNWARDGKEESYGTRSNTSATKNDDEGAKYDFSCFE